MTQIERITTEYIDVEDRIRIAGEVAGDAAVVIWLTQRLLTRLLPPLLQWLEGQEQHALHAETLHSFAQHTAWAALTPEPSVRADAGSIAWLALSVDIAHYAEAVVLTFRGAHDNHASLTLATKPLRQWLGILHDATRKAEWPLKVWPQWLQESSAPQQRQAVVLH